MKTEIEITMTPTYLHIQKIFSEYGKKDGNFIAIQKEKIPMLIDKLKASLQGLSNDVKEEVETVINKINRKEVYKIRVKGDIFGKSL